MGQLNIHMTQNFEKDLKKFMKLRHLNTKAEAIRIAIKEGIEHATINVRPTDFSKWVGLGCKAPANPHPKFHSDDDLWN